MRADYLTYRTATSAAIKGLVLQVVVASVLIAYGMLAKDHVAVTTAGFAGIGILAWLALTIVYDQHRRERIEALEVEALAQTGGSSASVFQTENDMRPAARRLANLHKFFVPVISVVIALLLLSFGGWRLWGVLSPKGGSEPLYAPGQLRLTTMDVGWPIALGIIISLVGFVMARYTAGMAKQPAWANLRGGAAFLVGTVLLALAMAVGHVVDALGPDAMLRYMLVIGPAFVLLIGFEIVVNIILMAYRPRRAHEIPRAAFDSRLLGFVAAPDRIAKSISEAINYQLGFDVTGGWFYQLLSRSLVPLVAGGVLLVWLLSSITVVEPHQRGVVLRFGKPLPGGDIGPGLHLTAPWPIDSVYIPEYFRKDPTGRFVTVDRTVTGLRVLQLGTSLREGNDAILWTNDHPGDEVYQFVRTSKEEAGTGQSGNVLVDLAMVSVELPMHYVVTDVRRFDELGEPLQRDELLRAVAVREATRYFQGTHLDQVLGFGRDAMGRDLTVRIQGAFDALNPGADGKPQGAGVKVVSVGISGVHPPKAAAASFEAPIAADARRIANIQNAQADAVATLTSVVGDAGKAQEIIAELDKRDSIQADVARGRATQPLVESQNLVVQEKIIQAGGSAASTLAKARASRWERHMGARGQLARYGGQVSLYDAAPRLYMTQQYLAAVKHLMDDSRVYVVDQGIRGSWMQLNLEDKALRNDVFGQTGEKE
ncbi:MAG: SPFH domain-containing protein [Phycisphaerales bacterium]